MAIVIDWAEQDAILSIHLGVVLILILTICPGTRSRNAFHNASIWVPEGCCYALAFIGRESLLLPSRARATNVIGWMTGTCEAFWIVTNDHGGRYHFSMTAAIELSELDVAVAHKWLSALRWYKQSESVSGKICRVWGSVSGPQIAITRTRKEGLGRCAMRRSGPV